MSLPCTGTAPGLALATKAELLGGVGNVFGVCICSGEAESGRGPITDVPDTFTRLNPSTALPKDDMSGIVNRAIELLPSGEAWLSRQSIANPSLDNPTFKTLSDPQDIAFTLLQFTFTHHVAMDREGRKLFDLEASIPANLATYLTEVGPDLVKNYTVRASQIYVQQLVRQHIPAKAGMLSRSKS